MINLGIEYSFGSIVKKLMTMRGLKIADVAKKTGMPHTTITRIITGNTENPSANTLLSLAKFFDVSVDALLGRKLHDELPINALQPECLSGFSPESIPLIDWVSVKNWYFNKTKFLSEEKCQKIAISTKISNNACGIITDKSFGKTLFPKGSILIIDSDAAYHDGDYVVVSINKNFPTIKEICEDSGKYYLNSVGLNILSIELEPSHIILGKIVECRILF